MRSPIDGVIGDLDTVKLGDYVESGQAITGIVNNSTLWTLMQVPATRASDVAIGQTVKVASQTNPPVTGEGTVSFISLLRHQWQQPVAEHVDGEGHLPQPQRPAEDRSVCEK